MNICFHRSRSAAHFAMLLALTLVFGSNTALAGKKTGGGGTGGGTGGGGTTTPTPPAPANFRVTAVTAYTISVAWDPAPANSVDFSYHLSGAYHVTPAVLPKTATSHTFEALGPGNDYWLFIYTRDAAGNSGGQLSIGPVWTLRDTTAPWTAPVVSIDEIGINYAHVSWTRAADDGPFHYSHEIWINGALLYRSSYPRDAIATILRFLQPDTQYAVQVRTYDYGNNASPLSAPATFRTLPKNPNDNTPPSLPSPVFAYGFGDLEMELYWTESTDDFDDPENIRYDIFVNGHLEDIVFGTGFLRTLYGEHGDNLIEVFATDTSGNISEAGTTTIMLP